MAQWTIQPDGDGLRVLADGQTVISISPDGVQLVALLAHTGSIDELTAWLVRGNEWLFQASSPPEPPGEGDVKLFNNGVTGRMTLMDSAGAQFDFDPRPFARVSAAPPAVAPAPNAA